MDFGQQFKFTFVLSIWPWALSKSVNRSLRFFIFNMRKNNTFLEEIVRLEILYRYIIYKTWYLVGL